MAACPKIPVAVGVIVNAKKEILVALRDQNTEQGGLWEFPGGKVEPNETTYQALCRKLKEELGIRVISATSLIQVDHDYETYSVTLNAWAVREFSGLPQGREGQRIRWVSVAELPSLNFPAGSEQIIQMVMK